VSAKYLLLNQSPIYRAKRGFHIDSRYTPLAIATWGFISYESAFFTKLCLYLALRQTTPSIRTNRQSHPIIKIEAQASPIVQTKCNKESMQCNLTFQLSPVVFITRKPELSCTALAQKKLSVSVTRQISPFIDLTRNDDCG